MEPASEEGADAVNLIGLGGYAESGKDEVAKYLAERYGFVRCGMSNGLEQALLALDPIVPFGEITDGVWAKKDAAKLRSTEREFERYSELHTRAGYDLSKKNPEVRQLLQRLGTDVGRRFMDEEVWVRWLLDNVIDPALDDEKDVAVTAMRYPNELAMVKSRGSYNDVEPLTWWVHRPGYGPVNAHSSDNTLGPDDFDLILMNDGSLNELHFKIDKLLTGLPLNI